jgi:hypothetical protein
MIFRAWVRVHAVAVRIVIRGTEQDRRRGPVSELISKSVRELVVDGAWKGYATWLGDSGHDSRP